MAINWTARPGGDAQRPLVRRTPNWAQGKPAGSPRRPPAQVPAAPGVANTMQQGPAKYNPAKNQAPGATHPVTSTVTVTPPPPDMSGDKWRGYLTPDQIGLLNQASDTHDYNVGVQNRRIGDAQVGLNNAITAAQLQHDQQTARANEDLAARGMFQSSIRDNDLADIDAALAVRTNDLNTNFTTLQTDAIAAVDWLNRTYNDTLGAAQGDAAAAAMALPSQQPYQKQVTTQVPNVPPPPPPPRRGGAQGQRTPAGNTISRRTTGGMFGGQSNVPNPYGANLAALARNGGRL